MPVAWMVTLATVVFVLEFAVTVRPAQITTLEVAPGTVVAAAPEQETVDQVEGVAQLPF